MSEINQKIFDEVVRLVHGSSAGVSAMNIGIALSSLGTKGEIYREVMRAHDRGLIKCDLHLNYIPDTKFVPPEGVPIHQALFNYFRHFFNSNENVFGPEWTGMDQPHRANLSWAQSNFSIVIQYYRSDDYGSLMIMVESDGSDFDDYGLYRFDYGKEKHTDFGATIEEIRAGLKEAIENLDKRRAVLEFIRNFV